MNRSKQNCGNCNAFVIFKEGPIGYCHAKAPICMTGLQESFAHGKPVPVLQGVWPPTRMEEWCREWQSDVDFDLEKIRGN